jgi:hypothetical protein
MKHIRLVFLTFAILFITGCATLKPNESWENLLNKAKKPVYVISVYSNNAMVHVLFRDATGRFFTVSGVQFYSLKPGNVFY